MREQLECVELYPGTDEGDKSLWVRIKGHANMDDTAVGVHYSPPDKEEEKEEVDGAFCGQLEISSWS